MFEWRRSREHFPVALLRHDGAPVRDVRERGDSVAPNAGEFAWRCEKKRVECDGGHQRKERRHQSSRAADPERAQLDPPCRAVFLDEERGDQEPGEHEEQVDAQVPAAQKPVRVKEQHAKDREAAKAIEPRDVADLDARGAGCTQSGARSFMHSECPQEPRRTVLVLSSAMAIARLPRAGWRVVLNDAENAARKLAGDGGAAESRQPW